ncbi:DUF559 domain-containing protein [Bacillus cereus]|uniref:DUF559 domain-containing protein n=1 Tax=Bacillus cereus TaxID=1396 RepID=A0A2C1LNR4_BACCE|nr:DUF559 domain-containing protein [Bacillus cereus]PGU00117.1 hypothetical protein COD19_17375 [Bacillus cereus]
MQLMDQFIWEDKKKKIVKSLDTISSEYLEEKCILVGIRSKKEKSEAKGKIRFLDESLGSALNSPYTLQQLITIQNKIIELFYPFNQTELLEEDLYQNDTSYMLYRELLDFICTSCERYFKKNIANITVITEKQQIFQLITNLINNGEIEDDIILRNIRHETLTTADLNFIKTGPLLKMIMGRYNPRKFNKYMKIATAFCFTQENQKELDKIIDSIEAKKLEYIVFCTSKQCQTNKEINLLIKDFATGDFTIHAAKDDGYLVFNDRIPAEGLTWKRLYTWWENQNPISNKPEVLRERMKEVCYWSENKFLKLYLELYGEDCYPAILPQITIAYSPILSKSDLRNFKIVPNHRYTMDFMVIPNNITKMIIEIDGKEHYSKLENKQYIADPSLYAAQVKEDRELKLKGYSVFRFGGFEVMDGKEEELKKEMKKVFDPYFDVIH